VAVSLFRILLMTLAAAALSGCDLVVSKTPLISPADTRGAVMPREGWWVRVDDTCRFDARKPVRKWPRCLDSALVRPAVTAGFNAVQGFNTELGAWESYPFLMTPGDPQLVQYEDRRDGWSVYYYYGLKPVTRDKEGRMTEALIWFAQCNRSDDAIGGEVAEPRLPPGLSPDGETNDCTAADVATVRAAVVASHGPDDMRLRWARDARPDDFAK
jgi:hypothetical protein